jgi:hypothetical protein
LLVFGSIRNTKVRNHSDDGEDDGTNVEEPFPGDELGGDTCEEDASKEADGSEGAVETEYEVLSGSWAILLHVSSESISVT